jgi:L-ascorbate metabolism protein UlaG (beta-lactamase superfamily)
MESNFHMDSSHVHLTYVGGPTALIEFGGLRLLTDPTFDPAPAEYPSGAAILRKLIGPALTPEKLGGFDYVLLSHDHHFDNLDRSGRTALAKAKKVFTTAEGAQRLGGNCVGLKTWQSAEVPTAGGKTLRVVATPARHGPANMDRGPVNGFVFFFIDDPENVIYFAGDTVWFEGVTEVAQRFPIKLAVLNLGAARVAEVGPFHLTMTSEEGAQAARTFKDAAIVPLHFEGWAHFSEGRDKIVEAFSAAKLQDRLRWPKAGEPISIEM